MIKIINVNNIFIPDTDYLNQIRILDQELDFIPDANSPNQTEILEDIVNMLLRVYKSI